MPNNPYMHYQPNTDQPLPAIASRHATTAYLCGVGPPPLPRPQDLAMARLTSALNNGAFENPHESVETISALPNPNGPAHHLEVRIPLSRQDGSPPTIVPIGINLDIIPTDFLARIIANMDLDRTTAKLGWKSCDDNKTSAPRRLQTSEDVRYAFREMKVLLENPRRKKPVYMEIVNLTKPPASEPTAPKPSECAFGEELNIVKEKLKCATHSGPNRWCYVKPSNGQHCPLGIAELTLWARKIHDGVAEKDCVVPPNVLQLDDLAKKERERAERSSRRTIGNTQSSSPAIHFHLADSPIGDMLIPRGGLFTPPTATKRSRSVESSNEDFSDDDIITPIDEVLTSLHSRRPALDYPQYKAALAKAGIVYASAALDFDKDFYASDAIGMPRGAVGDFLRAVKTVMKKGKKRPAKRGRVEKENEEP